jgi:CRP-like cAMP-binding protein
MRTGKIQIQDFLAKLPLFNELSREELDVLAQGTTTVKVARGGAVFRCGDPCVGFHTVVYGQIKLSLTSALGEEKIARVVGPGDGFGEALMFLDQDYIVSAHAFVDSLLLHVPKSVVFAELERRPAFARKMLAGLSIRLRNLMRDVEAYSLRSGTERVVDYLLRLADGASGAHPQVKLDIGKRNIASRLNVSPEHLSRILRDLSERKLIEMDRRNVVIPDVDRLRRECPA